jgi:Permease family
MVQDTIDCISSLDKVPPVLSLAPPPAAAEPTYTENMGVMAATKIYSTLLFVVAAIVSILLASCPISSSNLVVSCLVWSTTEVSAMRLAAPRRNAETTCLTVRPDQGPCAE